MDEVVRIPMFPLAILPLPGELVPLHIFEPRYRELLQDMETNDISFGIYFNHETNSAKIGSLMTLESVIKRYPTGESDIIVKCENIFSLDNLWRTYKTKLYPGGDVRFWSVDVSHYPNPGAYDLFLEYMRLRNIHRHNSPFTIFQMATELNLDVNDRYKFLTAADDKRESFIVNRVKFQIHLLKQEVKTKDSYHLN